MREFLSAAGFVAWLSFAGIVPVPVAQAQPADRTFSLMFTTPEGGALETVRILAGGSTEVSVRLTSSGSLQMGEELTVTFSYAGAGVSAEAVKFTTATMSVALVLEAVPDAPAGTLMATGGGLRSTRVVIESATLPVEVEVGKFALAFATPEGAPLEALRLPAGGTTSLLVRLSGVESSLGVPSLGADDTLTAHLVYTDGKGMTASSQTVVFTADSTEVSVELNATLQAQPGTLTVRADSARVVDSAVAQTRQVTFPAEASTALVTFSAFAERHETTIREVLKEEVALASDACRLGYADWEERPYECSRSLIPGVQRLHSLLAYLRENDAPWVTPVGTASPWVEIVDVFTETTGTTPHGEVVVTAFETVSANVIEPDNTCEIAELEGGMSEIQNEKISDCYYRALRGRQISLSLEGVFFIPGGHISRGDILLRRVRIGTATGNNELVADPVSGPGDTGLGFVMDTGYVTLIAGWDSRFFLDNLPERAMVPLGVTEEQLLLAAGRLALESDSCERRGGNPATAGRCVLFPFRLRYFDMSVDRVREIRGTSISTPLYSGVIDLLRTVYPHLTATDADAVVRSCAADLTQAGIAAMQSDFPDEETYQDFYGTKGIDSVTGVGKGDLSCLIGEDGSLVTDPRVLIDRSIEVEPATVAVEIVPRELALVFTPGEITILTDATGTVTLTLSGAPLLPENTGVTVELSLSGDDVATLLTTAVLVFSADASSREVTLTAGDVEGSAVLRATVSQGGDTLPAAVFVDGELGVNVIGEREFVWSFRSLETGSVLSKAEATVDIPVRLQVSLEEVGGERLFAGEKVAVDLSLSSESNVDAGALTVSPGSLVFDAQSSTYTVTLAASAGALGGEWQLELAVSATTPVALLHATLENMATLPVEVMPRRFALVFETPQGGVLDTARVLAGGSIEVTVVLENAELLLPGEVVMAPLVATGVTVDVPGLLLKKDVPSTTIAIGAAHNVASLSGSVRTSGTVILNGAEVPGTVVMRGSLPVTVAKRRFALRLVPHRVFIGGDETTRTVLLTLVAADADAQSTLADDERVTVSVSERGENLTGITVAPTTVIFTGGNAAAGVSLTFAVTAATMGPEGEEAIWDIAVEPPMPVNTDDIPSVPFTAILAEGIIRLRVRVLLEGPLQ